MDLNDLDAELADLIRQMEHQPEDMHELYLQLREKVSSLQAFGMPLPDDIKHLMDQLEAKFAADLDGAIDSDGDGGGK